MPVKREKLQLKLQCNKKLGLSINNTNEQWAYDCPKWSQIRFSGILKIRIVLHYKYTEGNGDGLLDALSFKGNDDNEGN